MSWAALAIQCAPAVAPITIEHIIAVESGGNPLSIHVNGIRIQPPRATTAAEATATATRFIEAGYSVDLGLLQVNSRNLSAFGTTVAEQFDTTSCANIRTGAAILSAAYSRSVRLAPPGQPALQVALSIYNTGDALRGFTNGYVARYYRDTPLLPEVNAVLAKASRPRNDSNPYAADPVVGFSKGYFDAQ